MKKILTTIMAMVMMVNCTGCTKEDVKPEDVISYQSTIFVEHMGPETKSYWSWGEMYDDITNNRVLTHHDWYYDFAYSIVERANEYVEENDPTIEYYITIVVPDEETRTLMESVAHSTHVDIKIDTIYESE